MGRAFYCTKCIINKALGVENSGMGEASNSTHSCYERCVLFSSDLDIVIAVVKANGGETPESTVAIHKTPPCHAIEARCFGGPRSGMVPWPCPLKWRNFILYHDRSSELGGPPASSPQMSGTTQVSRYGTMFFGMVVMKSPQRNVLQMWLTCGR